MATATNFDFTDGTVVLGPTGTFTDNGVTFTFTFSNPTGPGISGNFPARTGTADTGALLMEDHVSATPADASMLLQIVSTNGFSKFSGSFQIVASNVIGSWSMQHNMNAIGTFSAGNPTLTVTAAQSGGSAIRFTNITAAGFNNHLRIADILGTINCFCAGTTVATDKGPRPVETLAPGDVLRKADGGTTEVRWLGKQSVAPRFTDPAKVNPIRIRAGALGPGVPRRDLNLSPDHAIEIDGLLINASALVNGHSIYQVRDMPLEGFTYYHVETETHELILAEGCPAESYLDVPDRSAFDNGAERAEAPAIQEMDLPRISSARLVPLEIKARLAANRDRHAA